MTQYGEGPIPWTAIDRYCEVYRIAGEQREDLFYHVQSLDRAYLEWSRERMKKQTEQRAARAPKTPTRRGR